MQKCICGSEQKISTDPFNSDSIYLECLKCGITKEVGILEEIVSECLSFREISPIIHEMYKDISSAKEAV